MSQQLVKRPPATLACVSERRNRSGRSLVEELGAFEAWLRSVDNVRELSWRHIGIVEWDLSTHPNLGTWRLGDQIHSPLDFEDRFEEILSSVQRDWVNLTAVTVHEETLVVAFEFFSEPAGGEYVHDGSVSVNWSGFSQAEFNRLVPSS